MYLPGSSSDSAGTLAAKGVVEEVSILQRRLSDESADRDAAKMSLQRLSKALEFYRQRLAALATPHAGGADVAGSNLQRVRDIVQAMDNELRAMSTSDSTLQEFHAPGQSPRQGYDVLRHALEEAQRRCESLNCDMVHQAEANEELVDALGTVKDANKRLLEQIRFQTDEISSLTQQRIGDEERMDKLTRKHQADHEAFRQNLQRQLTAIRTAASEEFGACNRRLVDKLRYLQTRIGIIAEEAGRLHQEQQRMRLDVSAMVDTSLGQLRSAETTIAARCSDHAEMCAKRIQIAEDAIQDIEGKLAAERDFRHSEGLAWAHRHSSLLAEREDVETRTSRDLSQKSGHMHALERTLSSERHAAATEQPRLEKLLEETQHRHTTMQNQSDQLQRDLVRLESSRSTVESECRAKEQAIADLRRQTRESDDALAAAVSGNDHLRDQMEEQRKRFQEKNEADLSDARALFEQKFNEARLSQTSEVAAASRQLQDMEEAVGKDGEALQSLRVQASVVASEMESFDRDAQMWRSQTEAIIGSRAAAEKEFKDSRQTFGVERLKLQAAIDRISAQTMATEEEIMKTADDIEEFRRLSSTRELEQSTRAAAAEAVVRDTLDELANLRRRCFETLEARSRADMEVATTKQHAIEAHAAMDEEFSNKKKAADMEKRHFEEQLAIDARETLQARDQLGKEKEMSVNALRRVQEESRSKLGAIERERVRIEETCRYDAVGASESVAQQQKYTDALEQDLHRLKYLLTESEANHNWVKQELDREDREAGLALRELQNGAHSVTAELEKLSKSEHALVRQVEETTQRNQQEQARLTKEVEAIRRSMAEKQAETDAKLNKAKSDLQLQYYTNEERHRNAIVADRVHEEALERENSQLKSFMGEQSTSSGGLANLHSKIETSIQRLQRHTETLRRDIDIHSSSVIGPPALTTNSVFTFGYNAK